MTEIGESISVFIANIQAMQEELQANPCDVDTLTLEVEGEHEGETKSLQIEVDQRRRDEAVTDVKSPHLRGLLRNYDMIIDCLADPQTAKQAKPVKVGGKATYVGLTCGPSSHAQLALNDLETNESTIEQQVNAANVAIAPADFFTAASVMDQFDISGNGSIFSLVRGVFARLCDEPHHIELEGRSCGGRAEGDSKRANLRLVGLARVLPRSKWTFALKIPPLGSHKYSREGGKDFRGTSYTKRSSETSAGLNYYNNKTTSETSGEGLLGTYTHTQNTQVGGSVDSYKQSRDVKDGSVTRTFEEKHSDRVGQTMTDTDGAATQTDIDKRLPRSWGIDLAITYNGATVETVAEAKKLWERIQEISKVITGIRDLFNKLPQLGWKFGFDISLFAGSFTFEAATKYVDGAKADGRYLATEYEFKGSIDLTILDVSVSLSFGIDVSALDSGLVAKIEGKVGVKASISKDIDMNFFSPKQEIKAKASATGKLAAIGSVTLLGKTLADAELSVSTALELDDATLTIELAKPPRCDFKGKLKMKPIELSGFIRVPWWFDTKIDPPIKITDGVDPLYTFS